MMLSLRRTLVLKNIIRATTNMKIFHVSPSRFTMLFIVPNVQVSDTTGV